MQEARRKVYVLDASAIIFGFSSAEEPQITCREVLDEARFGGAAPYRAAAIREGAGPRIDDPTEEHVKIVKKKMEEVGEVGLSDADVKLLALALDYRDRGWRPVIVSADYSVQNMALSLGIDVERIIHRGIDREVVWVSYCPACRWAGGVFKGGHCPRCGAKLKRRPSV